MTTKHHPMDETLADFVAGALDQGRAFVVAAHLRGCRRCRATTRAVEMAGGALLEAVAPVEMSSGALGAALEKLDLPLTDSPTAAGETAALDAAAMTALLANPNAGRWTWIGPGVHMRPLYAPEAGGARVFLLKAAPGTGLPQHTHTGTELTQVLQGAFGHAGGRFGPGDCDDADDTDEHNPVVEAGDACICLVAMDGQLKLRGVMGRLMQPFVRL